MRTGDDAHATVPPTVEPVSTGQFTFHPLFQSGQKSATLMVWTHTLDSSNLIGSFFEKFSIQSKGVQTLSILKFSLCFQCSISMRKQNLLTL